MFIYIVRHAYAGQHGDPAYPDDSIRPLTKKGQKRFKRTVKKLARRGFAPEFIATSPLVRCRQTADLIAERIALESTVTELAALAPGSDLDSLLEWTREQGEHDVAWVGHAPDVDDLAAQLIGDGPSRIRFAKGAVAAIEFSGEPIEGEGQLCWLATPDLMGC